MGEGFFPRIQMPPQEAGYESVSSQTQQRIHQ
jgi:hypothetical protein